MVEKWIRNTEKSVAESIMEDRIERLYTPRLTTVRDKADANPDTMRLIRTPRKGNMKYEVLSHYTDSGRIECAMCGVDDIDLLTLNHINHDGNLHRSVMFTKDNKGKEHWYKNIYAWANDNGFPEYYLDTKGDAVKLDLNILCYSCQRVDAVHYWEDDRINAEKRELIGMLTGGRNRCSECGRADIRALDAYHLPDFESWLGIRDIVSKTSQYKKPAGMLKYVMEHGKHSDITVLCQNCHHRHHYGYPEAKACSR